MAGGPIFRKAAMGLFLLRQAGWRALAREVRLKTCSDTIVYQFRYDLNRGIPQPPAGGPALRLRPYRTGDDAALFQPDAPHSETEQVEIRKRVRLLKANIPTCYVALTGDGSPCYIHWLFRSAQNEMVQEYYRGLSPVLAPDEALGDGVFVPERFRGKGIMAAALPLVLGRARQDGARWMLNLTDGSNLPSLRSSIKTDQHPFLERKVAWRFFRRRIVDRRLDENEIGRLERGWLGQ